MSIHVFPVLIYIAWMIVCLVFVFASLIEYALVNVIARRPSIRDTTAGGDGARQVHVAASSFDVEPDHTAAAARHRWKRAVRSSAAATEETPLQQATYSNNPDTRSRNCTRNVHVWRAFCAFILVQVSSTEWNAA